MMEKRTRRLAPGAAVGNGPDMFVALMYSSLSVGDCDR